MGEEKLEVKKTLGKPAIDGVWVAVVVVPAVNWLAGAFGNGEELRTSLLVVLTASVAYAVKLVRGLVKHGTPVPDLARRLL